MQEKHFLLSLPLLHTSGDAEARVIVLIILTRDTGARVAVAILLTRDTGARVAVFDYPYRRF